MLLTDLQRNLFCAISVRRFIKHRKSKLAVCTFRMMISFPKLNRQPLHRTGRSMRQDTSTKCVPACNDCVHCVVSRDERAGKRRFTCKPAHLATKEARENEACGYEGRMYRARDGVNRCQYLAYMFLTSQVFRVAWLSAKLLLYGLMYWYGFQYVVFIIMMCLV